ncbi:RNA-binding protein 25-like isoform X3 [Panicum virgatum]|nr:RNA-binding protein 25-like isoform X3 [Panicum virgatum]
MPRYPAPYPMVCPGFVPRPMPPPGVVSIQRPPMIPGIRGVPPLVAPAARPPPQAVKPADKPPTAVYVGKIAPTVDNDFLLSLLRLCGSVKSWKRAQDPSNGKPKGFGFCEFESAEGILRATRLLNKLSIDGQELVININDATKEYLKKYVEEKKRLEEKAKETENGDMDRTTAVAEIESSKPVPDESDKATEDAGDKDSEENTNKFGIITDEDSEADKDVAVKIRITIEEWLKTRPPPPPPPVQPSADSSGVDMTKPDSDDKNDADTDKKAVNETERSETGSPDKRKDRERDKDKRDKDFERYERERERERVRRDRERDREKDYKHREAEKLYRDRLKEWESREREKEYQRQNEKDKEKDRERDRRREILRQEDESDEEDNRKRKRRGSSTLEERKRRRQREKEEDLADKIREEEEIAEARRLAVELQRQADEAAAAAAAAAAEESDTLMDVDGDDEKETNAQNKPCVVEEDNIASFANGVGTGGGLHKQNNSDETSMAPGQIPDTKQNSNVPAKKLGFGLVGLGKRTSVPSVFAEEDDENNVDKSIRPLVPIDYSNEELQAVQANSSDGPNVAAAAEFAKRISVSNSKEEKTEAEKDRNRRSSEARVNDERREKIHDREKEKPKSENKKILDAKQLIDMIPRTKEELFAYDINWAIYDKHELHERMRPWISKKIIEFLGEEESTLVDYIVSCTKDHVQAEKMLELLQSILDVEAEMFVLKMWRMLIFEIKKVESGLSGRAKA